MTERGSTQRFDETPAELGRLVLLTCALVLLPLALLVALAPRPFRGIPALAVLLLVAGAAANWIPWRKEAPPLWAFPGVIAPALSAVVGSASSESELLALAILAALLPWAAVLLEAGNMAAAWGTATLVCFLVARQALGTAAGAACMAAFSAPKAVVAFAVYGKARRGREALARVRAEVENRERLVAVVAHDLRSPLSAIALSAHALERLVEDLLDVAAIREGRPRLSLAPAGSAAAARQVALALEDALPRSAAVPCDSGRVLQVLENLLSNVLHAMPGGGSVTLAVTPSPGVIRFSVRDSGPGLPVDIAPRLFQPYQRGAGARYKGAGPGQAISRGIVEGHGGRIWAEPAKGGEADLRFTLPLETADRTMPCAPSPS